MARQAILGIRKTNRLNDDSPRARKPLDLEVEASDFRITIAGGAAIATFDDAEARYNTATGNTGPAPVEGYFVHGTTLYVKISATVWRTFVSDAALTDA